MHLISFSILLIQVAAYALPTTSLSIYTREDTPESQELKPEKIVLNGEEYTITPLQEGYQGFGKIFKLEGGFPVDGEMVPAILKRVLEEKGSDDPNSKMLKEIGFLKRPSVDLHLFSEWSKTKTGDLPYQVDIVVKNLRQSRGPHLKPFDEWYMQDKLINGILGLHILCENVKQQLLWYAENEDLLYEGFSMDTIFIQKQAVNGDAAIGDWHDYFWGAEIMPIDWELADAQRPGVVDIADKNNKGELIEEYKKILRWELEERFSVDALADRLRHTKGGKLRKRDVREVDFQGKNYKLLQTRHADSQTIVYADSQTIVYSILFGGFEAKIKGETKVVPALMTVFTRGKGGARVENDSLPEGGRLLAEGEDTLGDYVKVFVDDR